MISQVFYSTFAIPLQQRCFTLKNDSGHQIATGWDHFSCLKFRMLASNTQFSISGWWKERDTKRTADPALMKEQTRNQNPCNTGYAHSLPPPELSWLLCWCPFSTLGYPGCSHPGSERTITSGTEISLQIQWQSGEERLKCLNARWGVRTLWNLVQLMFCLINLQMVHGLWGNPAVQCAWQTPWEMWRIWEIHHLSVLKLKEVISPYLSGWIALQRSCVGNANEMLPSIWLLEQAHPV